jgi:DNA-directed RNA polymerase beta' subunit
MNGLALVEAKTKEYSECYSKLRDKISTLEDEVNAVKKKHMSGIKKLASEVSEKYSELSIAIESNANLFEKPRTVIFHGIKVGMQKGKGKAEFTDDKTIKLIRKHFPEKADVLIDVIEKVSKTALNNLSIGDLKKIGVNVVEAQDVVFIKSTDSDIQKMVDALIAEDAKDEEQKSSAA